MDVTQTEAFLAAVPEGARRDRLQRDLGVVIHGVDVGSILNVELKEARYSIDGEAEGIFKRATAHFTAGMGGQLDPDFATNELLKAMHWDILFSGARTAISASKKLAKIKLAHPMVDAYRAAVALILPVALLLEEAKKVVVLGRRPPTPEVAAARAAKLASVDKMDRATCGCCLGGQAVLENGLVHDHGYRLPSAWRKTASCYGRQFRPLEVSDEGPRFMVDLLEGFEARTVASIASAQSATEFSFERRNVICTIRQGEVGFDSHRAGVISGLELDLRSARRELADFRKIVAEWKAA